MHETPTPFTKARQDLTSSTTTPATQAKEPKVRHTSTDGVLISSMTTIVPGSERASRPDAFFVEIPSPKSNLSVDVKESDWQERFKVINDAEFGVNLAPRPVVTGHDAVHFEIPYHNQWHR